MGFHERRELHNVAGEGVKKHGLGVGFVEDKEAVDRIKDTTVHQERQRDASEDSNREIQETSLVDAWVDAMTLGQNHPPPRVKAWIGDATSVRTDGAGPPVRAHGPEADVVQQVPGQHPPADQADQIRGERRPW